MVSADLKALLVQRTGVRLPRGDSLQAFERFVGSRVKTLNLTGPAAYLKLLRHAPLDGDEFRRIIASLTNPHTYFFRDQDQFEVARRLAMRFRQRTNRPLQVWSAGCATGEEAYSLAMLCMDLGLPARILATDLNVEALDLARRGVYRPWSLRNTPKEFVRRYLEGDGESLNVRQSIRQLIEFRFHNLVENNFPRPSHDQGWDWILCRNVFIYFGPKTIETVARGFGQVIDKNGWLFLSTTESLRGLDTPFLVEMVDNTSFAHRLATTQRLSRPPLPELRQRETELSFESLHSGTLPPHEPGPHGLDAVAARNGHQPGPKGFAGLLPPKDSTAPSTESRDGAESTIASARIHLEKGELGMAQARLETLLEQVPDNVVARVTLGNLQLQRHDFDEAISSYRQAQKQAPLLAEIHYFEGVAHRKLGDWTRAANAFRRAVFLEPDFWGASFLLGGTYIRLGREQEARRTLAHTMTAVEKGTPLSFVSCTTGLKDAELSVDDVVAFCSRYLQ